MHRDRPNTRLRNNLIKKVDYRELNSSCDDNDDAKDSDYLDKTKKPKKTCGKKLLRNFTPQFNSEELSEEMEESNVSAKIRLPGYNYRDCKEDCKDDFSDGSDEASNCKTKKSKPKKTCKLFRNETPQFDSEVVSESIDSPKENINKCLPGFNYENSDDYFDCESEETEPQNTCASFRNEAPQFDSEAVSESIGYTNNESKDDESEDDESEDDENEEDDSEDDENEEDESEEAEEAFACKLFTNNEPQFDSESKKNDRKRSRTSFLYNLKSDKNKESVSLRQYIDNFKNDLTINSSSSKKKPCGIMWKTIRDKNPKKTEFEKMAEEAWQRAYKKYSPTTEIDLSPVKPLEVMVLPVHENRKRFLPDEDYISGLSWVSSMSEQFYYDNSLLLVSSYQHDISSLKRTLINNIHPKCLNYYRKNWKNFVILGSGSYGDVLRVTDAGDQCYYAVKVLKKPKKERIYYHRLALLNYLRERNYLVKAKNSPFIVKFYSSAKIPNSKFLMLTFEYCLGSLFEVFHVFRALNPEPIISRAMDLKECGVLENLHQQYSQLFGFDILDMINIYVLELFCVLDYLAKCNIIHCDIKPENYMVGVNLHLKLADFGLVYNVNFITRTSQVIMATHNEIDKVESSNFTPRRCGTQLYWDPELNLTQLSNDDEFKKWMSQIQDCLLPFDDDFNPINDFMSDLFSTGLVMCQVLFLGQCPLFSSEMDDDAFDKLDLNEDLPENYNSVKIFLNKKNFTRYVFQGLTAISYPEVEPLINLLLTTLYPRKRRSVDYVTSKKFRLLDQSFKTMSYIDIEKIENISTFKEMKLNSKNVFLISLHENIAAVFETRNRDTAFNTFDNLLQSMLSKDNNCENFFDLKPGIEATF